MSGNKMTVTVFRNTETDEGYKIVVPEASGTRCTYWCPSTATARTRGKTLTT
jgi:hypothetical protein